MLQVNIEILHCTGARYNSLYMLQVNIETLHCSDLIEEAVRTNDVRSLITQLRERWNMYYPIMTEIDQVSERSVSRLALVLSNFWNALHSCLFEIIFVMFLLYNWCLKFYCSHAVDWIQDEGLVRVLVGKGGTIMFTLKMPPGYPFKGEITITNTSGLPANVHVEDCKVCYLLTWIKQSVNKTLL